MSYAHLVNKIPAPWYEEGRTSDRKEPHQRPECGTRWGPIEAQYSTDIVKVHCLRSYLMFNPLKVDEDGRLGSDDISDFDGYYLIWTFLTPQNKTHLTEINKSQARISGVEISKMLSNRFKHLHRGHYNLDRLLICTPARHSLRITWAVKNNLILGSHCTGLYGRQWDRRWAESAWGCSFSWTTSCLGADPTTKFKGNSVILDPYRCVLCCVVWSWVPVLVRSSILRALLASMALTEKK
jgi:hypothetical protein